MLVWEDESYVHKNYVLQLHIANEQRSNQGDADTSLNLKCSAETEHANCTESNELVGTGPVILKETTREVIGSEAVVVGLRPDGFQPLLPAVRLLFLHLFSFMCHNPNPLNPQQKSINLKPHVFECMVVQMLWLNRAGECSWLFMSS